MPDMEGDVRMPIDPVPFAEAATRNIEVDQTRVKGVAVAGLKPAPHEVSVVPIILSGGSGSRLWPVSRDSYPKQLWSLVSDRTLLQETALCASGAWSEDGTFAPPIVVCNQEHRFIIAAQLKAAGVQDAGIVLEPEGRGSAPAVAAAALLLAEVDPDAVLWVMAADTVILDVEALHALLPAAVATARQGRIVTLGVRPTAAENGYRYIELGDPLPDAPGAFDVASFREKPPAELVTCPAASGRHLLNSGIFVFTAATLLRELTTYEPAIARQAAAAVARRHQDLDFIRLEAEAFLACPAMSLDHAVVERTHAAAVIPAEHDWVDIGNWNTLWQVSPKDAAGNSTLGDVLLERSEGCYVRSEGPLTAVVGLKEVVVVTTRDAVLAMHRDNAQEVKAIVQRLRQYGRTEAVAHNRCHRPWGFYESLILQNRFQVKRIVVDPGQKLSLQKHFHRAEHLVVVHGSALVTRDSEQLLVQENESIHLPLGCVHRLENPGRIPLTLIEVQVGAYLGEDDIVRIEDDYARR
jgi:mannose-1-phosphate guanylyltransferase/mannose-6-phosphate isomerase